MICGALQTLNEEALEDVLQGDTTVPAGELPVCLPTITEHLSTSSTLNNLIPHDNEIDSMSLSTQTHPKQIYPDLTVTYSDSDNISNTSDQKFHVQSNDRNCDSNVTEKTYISNLNDHVIINLDDSDDSV